jgi:serine/threonine protein phosphatase PrpC
MTQLTEDHTLLARLQAMDHPILSDDTMFVARNFLYRSLGQEQSPPDLLEFTLAPGDRLMICSDGLWDEVDDVTIARTLAAGNDPARCAERLVAAANAAGGHDNSTALVLFVEAVEAVQSGAPAAAPAERTEPAAQNVAPRSPSASGTSSTPGEPGESGTSGDSDASGGSDEADEAPDGSEAKA